MRSRDQSRLSPLWCALSLLLKSLVFLSGASVRSRDPARLLRSWRALSLSASFMRSASVGGILCRSSLLRAWRSSPPWLCWSLLSRALSPLAPARSLLLWLASRPCCPCDKCPPSWLQLVPPACTGHRVRSPLPPPLPPHPLPSWRGKCASAAPASVPRVGCPCRVLVPFWSSPFGRPLPPAWCWFDCQPFPPLPRDRLPRPLPRPLPEALCPCPLPFLSFFQGSIALRYGGSVLLGSRDGGAG